MEDTRAVHCMVLVEILGLSVVLEHAGVNLSEGWRKNKERWRDTWLIDQITLKNYRRLGFPCVK